MKQNLFFYFLMKCIINLICKIEVIGSEEVANMGKKAFIIASNHLGRLDGFIAYTMISKTNIIFPLAKKYKKHPVFYFLNKMTNGVWIDQYNNDIGAVREIIKRLKAGGILTMAPEGTRSKTHSLNQGKNGTAYIASKCRLPIIPAALIGTEDSLILSCLKKLRRPKVKLILGKSFYLKCSDKYSQKEILNKFTDEIMCRIAALLPMRYRGYYLNHPLLDEILHL